MNPLSKIRHFENFHILLWLIKDSCWLMQWKLAGTIAFFPAMAMAIYICYKTRKQVLPFLVNLAVLCWISANSCWMFTEFYNISGRLPALSLFGLGLVFIFIYLYHVIVKNSLEDENGGF